MAISTPSQFQRVDKTTIGEQIREEEVNIVRSYKIFAMMEEQGRITFGHTGKRMEFNVRVKRNRLTPYGDAQVNDFPRLNRHQDAALPWRGYIAQESVGKLEKLQNRGESARIEAIAQITESLLDDVRTDFNSKFYIDGNAAGNESEVHGFKSFLGYTGTAKYTQPSDDYAGLSTVLGGLGGSVLSGAWPDGQFDSQYDAWSPLIVNYTKGSSAWAGSAQTWRANCIEAVRAGILHNQNTRGVTQGMLDMICMTAEMVADFRNALQGEERITVERASQNSPLVRLGFMDAINFDGVDLTMDADCPSGEAFGIKMSTVELCSMQDQLFVPSDDYDLETLSDRYAIDFFGNFRINPRGAVFWKNIGG